MANGYYLFSCNKVSRSTQSVVAMASYRADEKLYSYRDGETKSYKNHSVKPESFILKPDNAPDWSLNREKLWNEVERFENRDNARLARNIILGLPNDMTNEQQLELTKEYVQENFVDEGMVADVSIHRDEENNPHAHILLTVRPFNEVGEWEKRKSKRVPVLDEKGNQIYNEKGWRVTRSVKINDWDSTQKLVRWRENWSEKLNEKAKEFGSDRTYTDKSYKEQGKLLKPRHRLTRSEYQYEEKIKNESEKNGKHYEPTTYYAKKNEEIKQYNEKINNVIHLEDYRTKKDYKKYFDNIRTNLHVNKYEVDATRLLVDRVKGYVDFEVAKKLYTDFHNDRNKWNLRMERIEKENNSKRNLYATLIEKHKQDPLFVSRYGYDPKDFKEQIRSDLISLKTSEQKVNEQREKFNELKKATEISLSQQEKLLDVEFASVYENDSDFSYEEKHFAMSLLKQHNILLPEEIIKSEFINQKEQNKYDRMYIPLWKQAKDTITSIDIYNRTINKINKANINELIPQEIKDTAIKINTIKQLKDSYQNYLNNITPLIDQEIKDIFNKNIEDIDINVKIALLEGYSKLSENEKESLNVNQFIAGIKEVYEQQTQVAYNKHMNEQDGDRKQAYKDISDKAGEIAEGLFSFLKDLDNERGFGDSKQSKDRTKTFRRRGADGREL